MEVLPAGAVAMVGASIFFSRVDIFIAKDF